MSVPAPEERAPAWLCIGFNGRHGGYTSLAWGITDDSARELIAEFRDRIGEPDVESTAGEDGLQELGKSLLANTVTLGGPGG